MAHTVVLTFLALSLSTNPPVNKGSKKWSRPPPTEQPKPPPPPEPPPPSRDEPEDDEPQRPGSAPEWRTHQPGTEAEDLVLAHIRRNMRPIEGCYDIARGRSPRLQGEVVVEFDITSSGHVERERITGNSTGDAELGSCILQVVRSWTFRDKDSFTFPATHVRHPFRFQAAP